jgi:hypothetical protein
MVWNQDEKLESERLTMSEESPKLDMERLTDRVVEQLIYIVGAVTVDPKAEVARLPHLYLAQAQEQAYEEVYCFMRALAQQV